MTDGAHSHQVLVRRSDAVDSEERHHQHRTAMTGTELRRHAETAKLYTTYIRHTTYDTTVWELPGVGGSTPQFISSTPQFDLFVCLGGGSAENNPSPQIALVYTVCVLPLCYMQYSLFCIMYHNISHCGCGLSINILVIYIYIV